MVFGGGYPGDFQRIRHGEQRPQIRPGVIVAIQPDGAQVVVDEERVMGVRLAEALRERIGLGTETLEP